MAPSTERAPGPGDVEDPTRPPSNPRDRRLPISLKALLVFVAVAFLPSLVTSLWLLRVNRDAVVQSEQQLQAAVLAEVAGKLVRRVNAVRADADAIAVALSAAATAPQGEGDGLGGVRALLATRTAVDAVRFEVPSAKFASVLTRGAGKDAPESTPELRREADERGVAFAQRGSVSPSGGGVIVVPIPRPNGKGAPGYVTAAVSFAELAADLATVAETRFPGESASLLVADGGRHLVAAANVAGFAPGADAASLGIFKALPEGTPWTAHVSVVTEFDPGAGPNVGAIESVPELGWAVAIWRPKAVAYATLERMKQLGSIAALGGVVIAVLVALVAARSITRPVLALVDAAHLIGERRFAELPPATGRGDELGELDEAVHEMAHDLAEGERKIADEARLRGDLSRFLGKELVEQIVRGEHDLTLGGHRADVSVLFADVVAFTPLAESKSAEEVVALLNELFSVLSEVVFRHHGTVDKFLGDCIMAVWGAPIATPDHAALALAAAEDMLLFLETANAGFLERYGVEVRLGIGVNSGSAIVGNIGSDKRMEYTVIGDVVNVAARLEAIAAPNQILVAEATQELAGDAFEFTLLGERRLTGRAASTRVYALG